MINNLLQAVAPHHCYGCTKTGTVLCENCKYDIVSEPYVGCVVCECPALSGVCERCMSSYQKAWCVGDRNGTLESLLNAMKFDSVRDIATASAVLLNEILPVLPSPTVIVPIPTLPRHIRQRGFDHSTVIARQLASKRKLRYDAALTRTGNLQQRGKNKKERFAQAAQSFGCSARLKSNVPYLLVDDVLTTNATVQAAAKVLHKNGAETVWVVVVARQPLET